MSLPASVDVLCVGYACMDINFKASHHPGPDEKIRATAMHSCGGGPAANAAVAIARLGGTASFCGYLGRDALGEAHLNELKHEGVHIDTIFRGDAPTPLAAVTIKPDGARSIVDHASAEARVPENALCLETIRPSVLLLDGHQPLVSLTLLDQARRFGIPVVLDAGSVHDGTLALMHRVDYLIASEKFARQYSQESAPRLALASMDGICPFTAVTWGAAGVYWQDHEAQHHQSAFDIEAVDTTGAGDAFHGAFALGLARKFPARKNMRYASAVGALTCLQSGARTALPHQAQVSALLGT